MEEKILIRPIIQFNFTNGQCAKINIKGYKQYEEVLNIFKKCNSDWFKVSETYTLRTKSVVSVEYWEERVEENGEN